MREGRGAEQAYGREPSAEDEAARAAPSPAPSKRKGLPWWTWVLIIGGASVPACGILSAIAIYGVNRYLINAKAAEAKPTLLQLTAGMKRCASLEAAGGVPRGLPPTSPAVPSVAPAAARYQSGSGDWEADAFRCAGFSITTPQYFSYQWIAESPAQGVAVATADLNGDGVAELRFTQSVACSPTGDCTLGAVVSEGESAPR